ncbi:DUF6597 domain-containing transcriptional factor [Hydrogenophaga luteola]|uniref:DUF6597 domain-containing transcriptional factor n=1 Tax=Hydrogenophaga luteola TaxID=1591122 RepID=A0ABV7W8P7_9BURK
MLLSLQPSPPLRPFIDCYWHSVRGPLPHTRESMLPTGCADIVVPLLQDHLIRYGTEPGAGMRRLRGAIVQGPSDRFFVRGTEGPSAVVGVHFAPGGAAVFFGGALSELRNRTERLEDLWGPAAADLREQLQAAATPHRALKWLDTWFLRRLTNAAPADPLAAMAVATFRRDPTRARVQPVMQEAGCSPEQFIRRFERAVGLTPKRFASVTRFGAVLPLIAKSGPQNWAQVAASAGYFDQSHLIREFRHMSGLRPGAYAPVSADQPTHVALAR